jgi:terminase small subunit-like protein
MGKADRHRRLTDDQKTAMQDAILEWVSIGQTVRSFCRLPDMPHWTTVHKWANADPEFKTRLLAAKDLGYEAIAEECLEIADTTEEGVTTTEDEDGKKTVTGDMFAHRKLRIETRLKLLAKWDPRRYGDKQQVEHTGTVTLEALVLKSLPANTGAE